MDVFDLGGVAASADFPTKNRHYFKGVGNRKVFSFRAEKRHETALLETVRRICDTACLCAASGKVTRIRKVETSPLRTGHRAAKMERIIRQAQFSPGSETGPLESARASLPETQ